MSKSKRTAPNKVEDIPIINTPKLCWVVNLDINVGFLLFDPNPNTIGYCRVFENYPTVDSLMYALDNTQGSYTFVNHLHDGKKPDLRSHIQNILNIFGIPKMPTDNFNSDFLYPLRTFEKAPKAEKLAVSRVAAVKSSFDITEIIDDNGEDFTNYLNLGAITITLRTIF